MKLRALTPAEPIRLEGLPKRGDYRPAQADIAGRMKPTRRRLNILSALATGHLPWGVPWPTGLSRHGDEWVLCCGHVLRFAEAQDFVSAGLLAETQPVEGYPRLGITDAGRVWLSSHWPA